MASVEEASEEGFALVECRGNTTGYRGVRGSAPGHVYAKWLKKGKSTTLGPFNTPKEAALVAPRRPNLRTCAECARKILVTDLVECARTVLCRAALCALCSCVYA